MKCEQEIAYLMYNDQPPIGSKSMNHGHTKGELTAKFLIIDCCESVSCFGSHIQFICCLQHEYLTDLQFTCCV